jgi:hypothetical protein
MSTVEVTGVKDTIKALRNLDPELRKQFNKDAKRVAEPITSAAKNAYPTQFLSGMSRPWSQRGRQLFPYSQAAARQGVVVKINTNKRAVGVITVIQKNPAASIVDMAGKRGGTNAQGARFIGALFGSPSRIMWPAAESQENRVENAMIELVKQAAEQVENRITVIR